MEKVSTEITLRRATVSEVKSLRHRVLRPGKPESSPKFEGDDLPTTLHFGAFADDEVACCLTLLLSEWNGRPAWQLRGMATDERFRGGGIGQTLVDYAMREARVCRPEIHTFWCNARQSAAGFYKRLGWTAASDLFDVPDIGMHVKMVHLG